MRDECQHGSLRRKCIICEYEQEIDDLQAQLDAAREDCKFLLRFAPEEVVPAGLDPTFYHTLTYEGDFQLQERVDSIRAALVEKLKEQDDGTI